LSTTDSTPALDFDPSIGEDALERGAIESLQANRLDPKFLYVTAGQSKLWREVFLRHSPIHGNPEFARIYRDAFAWFGEQFVPGKVWIVGLGCGTGLKELALYSSLKARGQEAEFSAVDVSRELVLESAHKLVGAGAEHRRSLVCDLARTAFLSEWLDGVARDLPRRITFFGLVPNLAPSLVIRLFRAILRPGDILLVSAHLAPIGDGVDLPAAMNAVLPQYDNSETLAWLAAAVEHLGLQDWVDASEMTVGEVEGVPAFLASAPWKTKEPFEKWGHSFLPKTDEPLRLFHSLRYTPSLFEDLLRREGFEVGLLAVTACRQEGIWSVTKR
jgi:L-histidine N-alpha-methyltransferase